METLDRQCEKFMGGPTVAHRERVHVTINSRGAIFLNQKAHATMGRPLAVYLYYNREKDMIILERTDALRAREAFLLREIGHKGLGRYIHANPFCKHFRIKVEGTVRFLHPEVDAVGRLYLKLRDTITVSRLNPTKRKKKA
jgi:hypothetical protein